MENEQRLDKLMPAWVRAQADMKTVPKNGRNPHFKSKFATLDDILATIKPVLSQNGLSVSMNGLLVEGGIGYNVMLYHESGQMMSLGLFQSPVAKQDNPQAVGSAMTYLHRYALGAAMNIASVDDDDAEGAMDRKSKKQSGSVKVSDIANEPEL